jgi:hypothetical protein
MAVQDIFVLGRPFTELFVQCLNRVNHCASPLDPTAKAMDRRPIEQSHNILTTSIPVILTSLRLIFRTHCAQLFTYCLKIYRQIQNVMKLMIPRDTGMSAYQLAVHPDTLGSYVVTLVTITNINRLPRAQAQFL